MLLGVFCCLDKAMPPYFQISKVNKGAWNIFLEFLRVIAEVCITTGIVIFGNVLRIISDGGARVHDMLIKYEFPVASNFLGKGLLIVAHVWMALEEAQGYVFGFESSIRRNFFVPTLGFFVNDVLRTGLEVMRSQKLLEILWLEELQKIAIKACSFGLGTLLILTIFSVSLGGRMKSRA